MRPKPRLAARALSAPTVVATECLSCPAWLLMSVWHAHCKPSMRDMGGTGRACERLRAKRARRLRLRELLSLLLLLLLCA